MAPIEQASIVNQHLFEKADFYINNHESFGASLTPEEKLALFSTRKQLLAGDCDEAKPGMFESEDKKKKWKAWKALEGVAADEVVAQFVTVIATREPDWESWDQFPSDSPAEGLEQSVTTIQAHLRRYQVQQQQQQAEAAERDAAARKVQAVARKRLSQVPAAEGAAAGEGGAAAPAGAAWRVRRQESQEAEAEAEEKRVKLQNFWHLLLRGITVLKYRTGGAAPHERVLWLDAQGERLYLEREKKSDDEMEQQAVQRGRSRGLFLRDIAEVRSGANTHVFKTVASKNDSRCMSLIGTERTLDVELPSEAARDELVARFHLLLAELQVSSSERARARWGKAVSSIRRGSGAKLTMADAAVIAPFKQLLLRGVEVLKHCTGGQHRRRVMWLDRRGHRLYIDVQKRMVSNGTEKGIDIADISEVRPGINSKVFERYSYDPALTNKCLSIVGSERTINLQLPSMESRDTLVWRLALFVRQYKIQGGLGGSS